MLWIRRFGKRDGSELKHIADAKLRGGHAILFCHLRNHRIFQRLAVGNGGIGLHLNPLRLAEIHQLQVAIAYVQQDLIDHWLNATIGKKIFKIIPQKVGHADDLDLTRRLRILQRTPDLFVFLKIALFHAELPPRLRRVNDHLVKIVKPHSFQRLVDGLCRSLVGL